MIICVDIGNSNAVVGIWQDKWQHIWRISTKTGSAQAVGTGIANRWIETGYQASDIAHVLISSVVPALTPVYLRFFENFTTAPVDLINAEIYHYLRLQMLSPAEIGTDLVANAYGALQQYQSGCLIVDFGTALTFLAVSEDRQILGASIAPGIETALKSLRGETALLPDVPLGIPDQVAGRHTVEAIQSGVIIGYEGMLLHLIGRYRAWYPKPLKTIATGGLINVLTEFHGHFDIINPTLTLDGIRLIGEAMKR